MIYIDQDGFARHTNLALSLESPAETRAAFNGYRRFEVEQDKLQFLLDYYNDEGDLSDTIFLDAAGFESITGQKPKSDAEYCEIDVEYWRKAREEAAEDRP